MRVRGIIALGLVTATAAGSAAAQGDGGCAGQPNCAETRGFTATIINFRPSTVDVRTRAIAITMRFQNRTDRPLILGYVAESGIITDDQGQRYLVHPASVRGIGVVSSQFDPKFVLQPGEGSDARFDLVMAPSANRIVGTRFEMDIAIREIDPLPANQFRLGREHSLRFAALAPSAMGGAAPAVAAPASAPAPAPAAPAAAPEPESDPCAGKSRCYGAGPFTAEVTRVTPSQAGRHHVLTLTVRFRNLTTEPLILGYKNATSGAIDEHGNRYYYGRAGTHDGSVKGMGLVTGRSADPQFALRPGQSRDATVTVVRFNAAGVIGTAWSFDAVFEQLEILPSNQVRSVREYAVSITDLSVGAAGAAQKLLNAIRKPNR